MQICIHDSLELPRQAARLIIDCVRSKPDALLCLAGGDTPRATYGELVKAARAGEVDFSRATFVGLDEWVGLPADYPGSCTAFMRETLFAPLGIAAQNIVFFDAVAADLAAECARVDAFLAQHGPLDLTLLGMGMNGHLGMNEPGCDVDAPCVVTDLDPITIQVGQKYFGAGQPVLKHGITLGMAPFMASRKVLLLVSGARKAATLARALEGPIGNQLPASLLRQHPDAWLLADHEAAGQRAASAQ